MNSASNRAAENLAMVQERIESAAARAGRRVEEITLVAVSKTHSARKIEELYAAGVKHFGENRVQEWEAKRPQLVHLGATWHMIGHLQKNKAARAAQVFNSIDSVDGAALAEKLDRTRGELAMTNHGPAEVQGKSPVSAGGGAIPRLRVLIEVKLDPEPAKSGASIDAVPRLVETIARLPNLDLCGLMGIAPFFDNPEETRPYFRRLRELRDAIHDHTGSQMLPVLSMGMSHDFEIAIEEGADEVRVGMALFGAREKD